jgi:hypothetical protein
MTLSEHADTAIEQILDIASRAIYGTGDTAPADIRFRAEVRFYLEERKDIDAALAILISVGEELGLVTRDDHGQFQARKNRSAGTSAAPTSDAEDHLERVSSETSLALSDASLTPSDEDHPRRAEQATRPLSEADETGGATAPPVDAMASEERDAKAAAAATDLSIANEPDAEYWSVATASKKELYAKAFQFRIGLGKEVGDLWAGELRTVELKSERDAFIVREIGKHARPDRDAKVRDYMKAKETRFKKMEAKRAA